MRRDFVTLDGLRGTAAIAVLVLHAATAQTPELPVFGSAYLAVDLFFLLSGFVIGHAYDAKLSDGMGFRKFFRIRVIRLYPLYLLGLAVAIATPALMAVTTGDWWLAKPTAQALPWAVFILPRPVSDPSHWFIINPPAWSLFYEMLGNILYALLITRLDKRTLLGIVVVAGLVLTAISLHYGTINAHPNWPIWFLTSFSRMAFSFTLGLLFYRWWREGVLPAPHMPAGWAILLFLVLIALPSTGPAAGALTAAVVLVGFPIVLLIGIANEPSGRAAPLMSELGRISYALYILHWPIMVALAEAAAALDLSREVANVLTVPVSLAAARYAARYFDEPLRAWIGRGPRPPQGPTPLTSGTGNLFPSGRHPAGVSH